ncbi:unnamed protein product [Onchocerca flexuosa]|uniref:Uncharacterized protein n=1 Tax=Onchocerca flexuosa TaxID=387005 RepID=A0A183H4Q0_9BILA|nr:unnamed protein product [Onchocerca flexuosa]
MILMLMSKNATGKDFCRIFRLPRTLYAVAFPRYLFEKANKKMFDQLNKRKGENCHFNLPQIATPSIPALSFQPNTRHSLNLRRQFVLNASTTAGQDHSENAVPRISYHQGEG